MASRGLNKVLLIGHVGRDPEMKYTPSGTAVANFSLATNETYKDKEGNLVDRTDWHRIVTMGRTAEVMGEYLKKGQQVFVEGQLQTRSWDDDKGNKRYITEVKTFNIQFLGRKSDSGAGMTSDSDIPPPSDDYPPPDNPSGDEPLPF